MASYIIGNGDLDSFNMAVPDENENFLMMNCICTKNNITVSINVGTISSLGPNGSFNINSLDIEIIGNEFMYFLLNLMQSNNTSIVNIVSNNYSICFNYGTTLFIGRNALPMTTRDLLTAANARAYKLLMLS